MGVIRTTYCWNMKLLYGNRVLTNIQSD